MHYGQLHYSVSYDSASECVTLPKGLLEYLTMLSLYKYKLHKSHKWQAATRANKSATSIAAKPTRRTKTRFKTMRFTVAWSSINTGMAMFLAVAAVNVSDVGVMGLAAVDLATGGLTRIYITTVQLATISFMDLPTVNLSTVNLGTVDLTALDVTAAN